MTDEQFDIMLKQALIDSIKREWVDMPLDEDNEIQSAESLSLDKKITKLAKNPARYIKRYYMPAYKRVFRHVATIILIMATLFGSAMLHPVSRAWVKEIIVTWFDDHNEYSYNEQSGEPLYGNWYLECVPEGFELSFEVHDTLMHIYEYQNNQGDFITIEICSDTARPHFDNEHYKYSNVQIGDFSGDAYISQDSHMSNHLIFLDTDNDVWIHIIGDVEIEEIINAAKSIR